MTKSQCYAEISRCQSLIQEYNDKIQKLRDEITKYTQAQGKMESVQSELAACVLRSTLKLVVSSMLQKINGNIVGKYTDGMNDLLTGQKYKDVKSGLEDGVSKIVTAIKEKEKEITTCNNNISSCNSRIQAMRDEIARIEAAEAEAARLAAIRAEEERLAAEAAKASNIKK